MIADQSVLFEIEEERAAICEFDGLMSREEAEKQGKLAAEEWRFACEVRSVLAMKGVAWRREYLNLVESRRGKGPADALRDAVRREWDRQRIELAGQA